MTIVEMFRRSAAKFGKKKAIIYKEHSLTYAELDRLSENIAAHLITLGVCEGKTVGIIGHKSEKLYLQALSVLKAGAAYVPLDPSYPNDRLAFMLKDAGAEIVIAEDTVLNKIAHFDGKILHSEISRTLPNVDVKDALLPNGKHSAGPKDGSLFIILYTSGSTGTPKGVLLTHDNLAAYMQFYNALININENDNCSAYPSFGFDAHMVDTWPTLCAGATLVVIPDDMRLDLRVLGNYFDEQNVTISVMTTQIGRQFATSIDNKSLRALVVGGEVLTPLQPPKNYKLYNIYGPTETTIGVTCQWVDRYYDNIPIGKPNSGVEIYMVKDDGSLAKPGEVGELCIAGRQVGSGYLNDEEKTKKVFVRNPFNSKPEFTRMYKTGDLAKYLPDGAIEILGRTDSQVKIRGFRVELSEIEGQIRKNKKVRDATVVAVDAPSGGKALVAYIVPVDAKDFDEKDLKDFVAKKLPGYMVPAYIVCIDAIPLTVNMKVDSKKLPSPFALKDARHAVSGGKSAVNNLEKKLHKMTSDILGYGDFNFETDLFSAGLTSLSLISLSQNIFDMTKVQIDVPAVFKRPTLLAVENQIIEKLILNQGKIKQTKTSRAQLLKCGTRLSPTQFGIYVFCVQNPATTVYNLPFDAEFPASVSHAEIKAALCAVYKAHPALAAHLFHTGSEVWQKYSGKEIEIEDLGRISEAGFKKYRREFTRAFKLENANLYRAAIVNNHLLFDVHHLVFDGYSLDIFISDILDYCNSGKIKADKHELLSFLEIAECENNLQGTKEWEADKAFFSNEYKDFTSSTKLFPDLRGASSTKSEKGKLKIARSNLDIDKVNKFSARIKITPSAILEAAFAYTLARWTGNDDIYFDSVNSGRENPELKNTIGMFVKVLPIHITVPRGASAKTFEFLNNVKDAQNNLIAHQSYPYSLIYTSLGLSSQIVFVSELGIIKDYSIRDGMLKISTFGLDDPIEDIIVLVEEENGQTFWTVQYDDSKYSKRLSDRFVQSLNNVLTEIIKGQNGSMSALDAVIEKDKTGFEKYFKSAKRNEEKRKVNVRENKKIIPEKASTHDAEDFIDIFKNILELNDINDDSNFFESGGTSLSATRVIISIEEKGLVKNDGSMISYADLFKNPTPGKLAMLAMSGNGKTQNGGEGKKCGDNEIDNFDYAKINKLITLNELSVLDNFKRFELGDVLLTGTTGFLGVHVLQNLIKNENGKIYCMVRKGHHEDAETRLKSMLQYYGQAKLSSQIEVVEGDLTETDLSRVFKNKNIKTIINCAANVSHFAVSSASIDRINVDGATRLIDLAKEKNARLIHISTQSVAGMAIGGKLSDGSPVMGARGGQIKLKEDMLYFGQNLDNLYMHSKFIAERNILSAIESDGLDAKIMRLGNLMARSTDSKFQMNYSTNSFVATLKAFQVLGCFPFSKFQEEITLSPIDQTADAILTLAKTPKGFFIFHPDTSNKILFGDLIEAMITEGIKIDFVEDDVFSKKLRIALDNPKIAKTLTALIAYQSGSKGNPDIGIGRSNEWTTSALIRLGWHWPLTSEYYLDKLISNLMDIGYF
jgi:amino acid adenylation domain-containing protein